MSEQPAETPRPAERGEARRWECLGSSPWLEWDRYDETTDPPVECLEPRVIGLRPAAEGSAEPSCQALTGEGKRCSRDVGYVVRQRSGRVALLCAGHGRDEHRAETCTLVVETLDYRTWSVALLEALVALLRDERASAQSQRSRRSAGAELRRVWPIYEARVREEREERERARERAGVGVRVPSGTEAGR